MRDSLSSQQKDCRIRNRFLIQQSFRLFKFIQYK